MDIQDKYGIQEAINRHFSNQRVLEVSDRLFALKNIGAIWEEGVFIKKPLFFGKGGVEMQPGENRRTTDQEIWEIDKRQDGCNFFV